MMWAWLKMAMAVAVVLMPGGFPLLLTYIAVRTLRLRWHSAQVEAQSNGREASLRHVVSTLELKELVREARASL